MDALAPLNIEVITHIKLTYVNANAPTKPLLIVPMNSLFFISRNIIFIVNNAECRRQQGQEIASKYRRQNFEESNHVAA